MAAAAESDTRGKNAPPKRPNATTADEKGITVRSAVSEQCRRFKTAPPLKNPFSETR